MKSIFFLALALAGVSLAADDDTDFYDWDKGIDIVFESKAFELRAVCETSDASPLWHQTLSASNDVRTLDHCGNPNHDESHCTKLADFEGSRISICGDDTDVPCDMVAAMANGIVEHCNGGGDRAGGWGIWRKKIDEEWEVQKIRVAISTLT